MIKVRSVKVLPGYGLSLRFSDGTSGIVDMKPIISSKRPFRSLSDKESFDSAVVEFGTVAWPAFGLDVAAETLYAYAHGLPKPKSVEDVRDNELQVSLRELRKVVGKTQEDLAEETGLTQGALSHFENAPDHKLSALRKYVAALGGELEIAAVIDGRRFPIHGV